MEEALEDFVPLVEKKPRIDLGDDREVADSFSEATQSQSSSECHLKSLSSSSQSPPGDEHERPHKSQLEDSNKDSVTPYCSDADSSDCDMLDCHKLSHEDSERYLRELQESDGYDITELDHPFPNCIQCMDLTDKSVKSDLTEFVNSAIEIHNKEKNATLELLNIVKANRQWGMSGYFYITFEAVDGIDAEPKIYQARLFVRGDVELEELRVKPDAKLEGSRD